MGPNSEQAGPKPPCWLVILRHLVEGLHLQQHELMLSNCLDGI